MLAVKLLKSNAASHGPDRGAEQGPQGGGGPCRADFRFASTVVLHVAHGHDLGDIPPEQILGMFFLLEALGVDVKFYRVEFGAYLKFQHYLW